MFPKRALMWMLSLFMFMNGNAAIRHLNIRDGLSSRQVYELEQDNEGFIWIFTNLGLDRFDGTNVKHYSLDTSKESNDYILSATTITKDSDGTVWLALKSGDIFRYDSVADSFDKVYSFPDPDVLIYYILVNDDGSTYICTNDGLYLMNYGATPERIALKGILSRHMVSDDAENLYVGTESGVYRIKKGERSASLIKESDGMHVLSMAMTGKDLYIGTFVSGVYVYDTSTDELVSLGETIPSIPINAMVLKNNEEMLIGVDGAGVYTLDTHTRKVKSHFTSNQSSRNTLSGNTVTDILVDSDNGIWISTTHNGVNYIPPFENSLEIKTTEPGNPNSLISDHVNVIFEDSEKNLWYGTDKGVSVSNPFNGVWRHYLQRNDHIDNVILSVGEDSNGNIWVGSYGAGATVIDKHSGRTTQLPPKNRNGYAGTGTQYLFTTFGDSRGNVWMGGINGELTKYNINDGTYAYYDEDCIASVIELKSGELLFGGNKGVGRYNREADKFEWMTRFDTIDIRYPVRCIYVDTDDNSLWIGTTGDGLVHYDRNTEQSRRYTKNDGLSANAIYSIMQDPQGDMWITTETDLYRIQKSSGTLRRFTDYLGYTEHNFNPSAGTVTSAGTIIAGSADGSIEFNPYGEFSKPVGDHLFFTDFKIHNQSVQPSPAGSPLSQNINTTGDIYLTNRQNNLQISFAVLNYPFPQRIGYSYKLEGLDEDFRVSDMSNTAGYRDLAPGNYTFHVIATDLYTGTRLDQRSISIVIKEPLWLSWWAKCGYALALAFIVILVTEYIRRHNREKYISDQIRTFSAMAHDIRTPMSLIKGPILDIEREKDLSEKTRMNLAQARAGINRTMEILNEMMELRQSVGKRKDIMMSHCDLEEFIDIKIMEFRLLSSLKDVKIIFDRPCGVKTVLTNVEILGHIIDNLLSNAIKYTPQGEIHIKVGTNRYKKWYLSVRDTGIGISRADRRHVFRRRYRSLDAMESDNTGTGMGLLITRQLVKSLKGSISFTSEQGSGSEFTVKFPLHYSSRYVLTFPRNDSIKEEETATESEDKDDSRPSIYVIDDDKELLNFIKTSLDPEYKVYLSADSLKGFEEVRKVIPDLIITDVMMPQLRGDELCRHVKGDVSTSHIPVILLSGLSAREDILSGFESHADDYIVKPFDMLLLKARIKNLLKSRQKAGAALVDSQENADTEAVSELDKEFMKKVMDIIDTRISDSDFSIQDLCLDLGMSRTSVYNKIKALTGQSLNEFIRYIRLNRGKTLLESGRYNIGEVAYMVGFSDPKYFSTCFKKQFGISPSKL